MWIPKTEEEIVVMVTSGTLRETETFDAKRELPKNSKELAKDVAAMATEGGVLLYGVDEDDQGRPTILAPISLAGARERVDHIVSSGIAEAPYISVNPIETAVDRSKGYLVVVVPRSPRAPIW